MNSEERRVHEHLSAAGLPDDLAEVALADEPGPSPEMVARMKARVLERVAAQATGARIPPEPARRRRPWARWSAAAAAVLVVAFAAAGPARVTAAMRNLLSFVPGFGMQQAGSFLLFAPRPVVIAYKGGTIEIEGLMATERQVTARVVLRGYSEWSPGRIGLETEAGRALDRGNAGGMGGAGHQEQWLTFTGPVDSRTESLTVVVEDGASLVRIPVPLVAASGERPLDLFGPSVVANGLRVAARVQASGDRTQVSLLLMGENPLVDGPGRPAYEAVTGVLTAPGWTGPLTQEGMGLGQMRTLTAFGGLPDNIRQVQLTVDRILVAEQGEARLTIPTAPGRVDQVVRLGRWDVTVTHTEQVGDALRIHLDLGPAAGPAALFRVGAVTAPGEPSVVEEFWAPERRQQTWVDLKLQRQTESVTLQFKHPEVLIDGPWVLDLPVDR